MTFNFYGENEGN